MPIVTSSHTQSPLKGDRLIVIETHVDHNGDVHTRKYRCSSNWDISEKMLAHSLVLNNSLVQSEKISYQLAIENGANPATLRAKHLTVNQKAKRIVRALMWGSPDKLLKAALFVESKTNSQIENFFTPAQRVRIRNRQRYIINNQAVFDSDTREEL